MTQSSDGDVEVTCPVCLSNEGASIPATGMVLTAAEALVNGDDAQIVAAYENSTPYDFHMAVTMYVDLLDLFSSMTGVPLKTLLAHEREQLNEAIAEGFTEG